MLRSIFKSKLFGLNKVGFNNIYAPSHFFFSEKKNGKGDKSNQNNQAKNNPKKQKAKSSSSSSDSDNEVKIKANQQPKNVQNKANDKQPKKVEQKDINVKYNISHNYGKLQSVSSEQQNMLETLVTQLLVKENISPQRAEEIKQEIRDPLHDTLIPHMSKINSYEAVHNYIKDGIGLEWYYRSLGPFTKLIRHEREERDLKDPNFIRIRSINSPMRYKDEKYLRPKTTDVRQNINSPDFMKTQPRLQMNYNFNFEEHKGFVTMYNQLKKEDEERILEQQKLLKYIKTYPDRPEVKFRFIKNVVIPLDNIPDYDVDISSFKPKNTRKSRRKYKEPDDEHFKNYDCWRSFDRIFSKFAEDQPFLRIELIPKKLIQKFGEPDMAINQNMTGTYYFEDENLDLFLIYDSKQTTNHFGPNYNEEFYKEQAENVNPELRKEKHLTPYEFWSSDQPQEFRIHYPFYSQVKRFKRWLKVTVTHFDETKERTIDQLMEEKFGKFDDFSNYELDRGNTKLKPAIHYYNPEYFMNPGDKKTIKHDPIIIPKYISWADGELFDYDEHLKVEAQKELERNTEKASS